MDFSFSNNPTFGIVLIEDPIVSSREIISQLNEFNEDDDIDDLNQSANDKFRDRLEKIKDEMKKRNIKYPDPLEMIDIWKTIKKYWIIL